ncbi:unnamed protein product [Rotaria magnacalcarata]|uniref:CRIM domain-containing protein n=1 Tax=Rotaria magnacalcarata TaxID=392030 RepID=A0A816SBK2_9BILA|nr:unnamed protein product [Rotaria magnacalcarata]
MSLGGGDLQVILRRIRHGFIVCDDSELCDKIISQDVESEQRRRTLAKSKSINIEKNDLLNLLRTEPDFILDELSHSPEWTVTNVQDNLIQDKTDGYYTHHLRRVRCETLGRLDEIKTENEAKRKVQIISWQDPTKAQETNELNHSKEDNDDSASSLFQRRTEPIIPLKHPSPLTALIQSATNKHNPYAQYAKYDGTPNISSNQSKKFTVNFQSQKQKLQIIVASNATVTETIGFVCYKYTIENREPALTQNDPSKYCLHIADDDGELDEFPPLTHDRAIGHFDFPHLILIEQQDKPSGPIDNTIDDNSSNIDTDDDDGSFENSSRSATPPSAEHRKSSSSVGKVSTNNFVQDGPKVADPIDDLNRLYESLNQKSYPFDYYIKLGGSKHVKIRIDVSGEQVRLDLLEKSTRLTWQSMPLTTQHLVDCNLFNKDKYRKKDRTRVYLVFESQQESDGSHAYQTYELETTVEIAEHFRDQILNIIKLKNPQGHDTYEQQQQQRENTKKRRSFLNIFGAGPSGSG